MTKVKFISFVPWVTIGSVIGSLFIVPMMPKIVDALYYKNKYNNEGVSKLIHPLFILPLLCLPHNSLFTAAMLLISYKMIYWALNNLYKLV